MTNEHDHAPAEEKKSPSKFVKLRKRGCRAGANQRKNWVKSDKPEGKAGKAAETSKRPVSASKETPSAGVPKEGSQARNWRDANPAASVTPTTKENLDGFAIFRRKASKELFETPTSFRKESYDSISPASTPEELSPNSKRRSYDFASLMERAGATASTPPLAGSLPQRPRFVLVPVEAATPVDIPRSDKLHKVKTMYVTNASRPRSHSDATPRDLATTKSRVRSATVVDHTGLNVSASEFVPSRSASVCTSVASTPQLRPTAAPFDPTPFGILETILQSPACTPSRKNVPLDEQETTTPSPDGFSTLTNKSEAGKGGGVKKVRRGKRSPEKRALRKELFLKKTGAIAAD